ncbi:hypothetical protein NEHOM01_0852 [Nematocida homosporus]|uniref:uncharacterized protein n=1 Tax=Nematocida homosporus TaxID=1912981 RepID=UPI002220D4DD|nr:uncharacterized protein NEHOM01_0852 [Nematocida homosporus]KAI5185493.1 hypothetical protein NEHOM01_0852 [Nematocida homosporus]
MFNQKRRIDFIKTCLVVGLCLLVLNGLVAASRAPFHHQSAKAQTRLERLAELKFPWAIAILKEYNDNHGQSTKSIGHDYCDRLGFIDLDEGQNRANLNYTIDCLISLFKDEEAFKLGNAIIQPDIQSMLILYAVLNEQPNATGITQTAIDQDREQACFITNLATWIHRHKHCADFIDNLENKNLKIKGANRAATESPASSQNDPVFYYPSLIHSKDNFYMLWKSPLMGYIHPLNVDVYMHKLNYLYDHSKKLFVVVPHNNRYMNMFDFSKSGQNLVARFTLESATRLKHATDNKYSIVASDEDFNVFMGIVHYHQPPTTNPTQFKHISNLNIKTFDEYSTAKSLEPKIKKSKDKSNSNAPKTDQPWERRQIYAIVSSGIVIAIAESIVMLLSFMFMPSTAALVYIFPFNIIALGLIGAVILTCYINSSPSKPLSLWEWLSIGFMLGVIVISLIAIFGLQIDSWSSSSTSTVLKVMVLVYQAMAILAVIACFVVRWRFNQHYSKLTRRVNWVLFALAIGLAAIVPFLLLLGLTEQARVLLKSHILIVSAIVFSTGILMQVFGRWFDKDREEHTQKEHDQEVPRRLLELTIIFAVMVSTLGLTTWAAISYDLLAGNSSSLANLTRDLLKILFRTN